MSIFKKSPVREAKGSTDEHFSPDIARADNPAKTDIPDVSSSAPAANSPVSGLLPLTAPQDAAEAEFRGVLDETGKPNVEQLEAELDREKRKARLHKVIRNTFYTLVVVASCAVLVAILFLPVLRIHGSSMTPTFHEGEIVVSVKSDDVHPGDIVGVYFGSKVLVKRVIAVEYQWVNIDAEGNVYIDGELLDEPYLTEKALGECNIDLPYQVADNSIFVMGDHRATSIDSRNTSVGSINLENVVGRIVFRVWPMNGFGIIRSGAEDINANTPSDSNADDIAQTQK